jgi:hypothetical protein
MRELLTFLIAAIFSIAVSASSFGGSITVLGVGGQSRPDTLNTVRADQFSLGAALP